MNYSVFESNQTRNGRIDSKIKLKIGNNRIQLITFSVVQTSPVI